MTIFADQFNYTSSGDQPSICSNSRADSKCHPQPHVQRVQGFANLRCQSSDAPRSDQKMSRILKVVAGSISTYLAHSGTCWLDSVGGICSLSTHYEKASRHSPEFLDMLMIDIFQSRSMPLCRSGSWDC